MADPSEKSKTEFGIQIIPLPGTSPVAPPTSEFSKSAAEFAEAFALAEQVPAGAAMIPAEVPPEVDAAQNAKEALAHQGNLAWLAQQVMPATTGSQPGVWPIGGRWDFKNTLGKQYQDFGNWHFGYVSAALGLSLSVTLRGGGLVQNFSNLSAVGRWSNEGSSGSPLDPHGPFGDHPIDVFWVIQGFNSYRLAHGEPIDWKPPSDKAPTGSLGPKPGSGNVAPAPRKESVKRETPHSPKPAAKAPPTGKPPAITPYVPFPSVVCVDGVMMLDDGGPTDNADSAPDGILWPGVPPWLSGALSPGALAPPAGGDPAATPPPAPPSTASPPPRAPSPPASPPPPLGSSPVLSTPPQERRDLGPAFGPPGPDIVRPELPPGGPSLDVRPAGPPGGPAIERPQLPSGGPPLANTQGPASPGTSGPANTQGPAWAGAGRVPSWGVGSQGSPTATPGGVDGTNRGPGATPTAATTDARQLASDLRSGPTASFTIVGAYNHEGVTYNVYSSSTDAVSSFSVAASNDTEESREAAYKAEKEKDERIKAEKAAAEKAAAEKAAAGKKTTSGYLPGEGGADIGSAAVVIGPLFVNGVVSVLDLLSPGYGITDPVPDGGGYTPMAVTTLPVIHGTGRSGGAYDPAQDDYEDLPTGFRMPIDLDVDPIPDGPPPGYSPPLNFPLPSVGPKTSGPVGPSLATQGSSPTERERGEIASADLSRAAFSELRGGPV